jgi:hypothetical protein
MSYNLDIYFNKLDTIIKNIITRKEKENITFDILDTHNTIKYKLIVLKDKHRQMKYGEIWQEAIGNYKDFINLKTGHETGLDIINHNRKIIIELKNRTNTDNYSSRKSNIEKLYIFKKNNPEYTCIYANINATNKKLTYETKMKIIKYNDVEIEHHIGINFINYIFGNDTNDVIEFIKNTIEKYSSMIYQ